MSDEERQKRYRKRLLALVAAQIASGQLGQLNLYGLSSDHEDRIAQTAVRIANKILIAAETTP